MGDLNSLFELKKKTIPEADAKIIMFETLSISYHKIQSNETFEVYFNSVLRSKNALRTGIKMTPYQQSFEINAGL